MKKLITILMVLLFLIQQVYSERVLSISLEVYKNDSVKLNSIQLMEGNPTFYVIPGDYILKILDSNNEIIIEKTIKLFFMIMTDPPTPTNSSPINLRLSYKPEMKILKLFHNDEEIFSKVIDVCNSNGACDIGYETFLSCPTDCPLDKPDGICIKNSDGVCDLDCLPGVDPDCEAGCGDGICETKKGESYRLCPEDCLSGFADGYCDKVKDGRCDPDCKAKDDPDCEELIMTTTVITTTTTTTIFVSSKCGDGICDEERESYRLCPKDCPSGIRDGYCDRVMDGICDPDCSREEDVDCEKENEVLQNYLPWLIFGLIILGIIFSVYTLKKSGGEKVGKRWEEDEIMEWIKRKLKEGEDPEVLRKGLSAEGYDPNLVDKAGRKLW